MGDKETKSDRTRSFIIEKSAPLFNKQGLAGTSISDIAKATGLTKGSIYGNFKDKDEVAFAAFDYNVQLTLFNLFQKLKEKKNAVDKLLTYPHHFKEAYQNVFENGGCAILNTAIEADDAYPELRSKVVTTLKNWENSLLMIIDSGKNNGEIKPEVNSAKYAALFIAVFEGGVMLSKVTKDMKYLFYSLDHLEDLVLHELKN